MSEFYPIYVIAGEMVIILIACIFYAFGGREGQGKWKRRFIGSLICSTALWAGLLLMGKFDVYSLLTYPLLACGFSLGYGSDFIPTKILKRSLIVLWTCLTGLLMCWILGGKAWLILPFQAFIGCGSIWLGVKNPVQASSEEFFVCLLLTECLALYPLIA